MNGFRVDHKILCGICLLTVVVAGCGADAANRSDFDLSRALIPRDEIRSGGPGKDGIPAIVDPKFVKADRAQFLRDDDIVVGYGADGQTRTYPLRILVWHELVNDTVGGTPIVVSYCPLCATAYWFAWQAFYPNTELYQPN